MVVSPGGAKLYDPLRREVDLPLRATYYPVGFRLEVATNSENVLAACAQSWGIYCPQFERPPLELRIVTEAQGERAPEPRFRAQQHLFSIVAGPDNFAVCDLGALFGCAFVSAGTAADAAGFRWFWVEPMVYMLLAQRYVAPLHAACVARDGRGLLLAGASGAGKSTLAFACARAGWSYLSDDSTLLVIDSDARQAIGKPHEVRFRHDAAALFPELAACPAGWRPNGKFGIEVPTSAFPNIRTELECRLGGVVFLERRAGAACIAPALAGELIARIKDGLPAYGDAVRARHNLAIEGLLPLPAYRLSYETLDDAVRLLSRLEI